MVTPVLMPWHEPAICYRVSEADADPIELLRAMGLWEELKTRSDDKDLKV